jgi:hypothetical protein
MRLQRRRGWKLIMTPEGSAVPAPKPLRDETLAKALVRAHRWRRTIEIGEARSITDLAEQEGVTDAYVCRLLPLTCLAPDIVEAILDGTAAEGTEASRDAGERAACMGGAAPPFAETGSLMPFDGWVALQILASLRRCMAHAPLRNGGRHDRGPAHQ